jgi:hypothetical protein
MQLAKSIRRRIRERIGDVDLAGDLNAAISANVNEPSSTTHVSSHQTVVRSGDTEVVREGDTRREETT